MPGGSKGEGAAPKSAEVWTWTQLSEIGKENCRYSWAGTYLRLSGLEIPEEFSHRWSEAAVRWREELDVTGQAAPTGPDTGLKPIGRPLGEEDLPPEARLAPHEVAGLVASWGDMSEAQRDWLVYRLAVRFNLEVNKGATVPFDLVRRTVEAAKAAASESFREGDR